MILKRRKINQYKAFLTWKGSDSLISGQECVNTTLTSFGYLFKLKNKVPSLHV